ncbi:MAG: hypothetical protein ABEI11_00840 [Haloarculaceae archaeon]
MATTDRTPMGIAHLTVVPAGFEQDAGGCPAEERDDPSDDLDGADDCDAA